MSKELNEIAMGVYLHLEAETEVPMVGKRNRDFHNGNEVVVIKKHVNATVRRVPSESIGTLGKADKGINLNALDCMIKDLCFGLCFNSKENLKNCQVIKEQIVKEEKGETKISWKHILVNAAGEKVNYDLNGNKEKIGLFQKLYGTSVDLEKLLQSMKKTERTRLIKMFTLSGCYKVENKAFGINENILLVPTRRYETICAKAIAQIADDDPDRSNKIKKILNKYKESHSSYVIYEKKPDGTLIEIAMTEDEFEIFKKSGNFVANSSKSNRFAMNSPYMALVEMGVIKDNNGPKAFGQGIRSYKREDIIRLGNYHK